MAEDIQGKKRAADDLNDIEDLRKIPAFNRYWGRTVLRELDDAREKLLHGKLTYSNDPVERQRVNIWEDVAQKLTGDEAACRRLVEDATRED